MAKAINNTKWGQLAQNCEIMLLLALITKQSDLNAKMLDKNPLEKNIFQFT